MLLFFCERSEQQAKLGVLFPLERVLMSYLPISFFSVVLCSFQAFYFRLFKRSLTGGNETPPSFAFDAPGSALNAAPAFALDFATDFEGSIPEKSEETQADKSACRSSYRSAACRTCTKACTLAGSYLGHEGVLSEGDTLSCLYPLLT